MKNINLVIPAFAGIQLFFRGNQNINVFQNLDSRLRGNDVRVRWERIRYTVKYFFLMLGLLGAAAFANAESTGVVEKQSANEVKTLSGMSILGNDEAPTSLVIVPWKSSELGDGIGIGNLLDERATPVDKEVFMRELSYYEIRISNSDELTDTPTN